jgi:hypothetical protein
MSSAAYNDCLDFTKLGMVYFSQGDPCCVKKDYSDDKSSSKRVSRAESWRFESSMYVNPRNRATQNPPQPLNPMPYQLVPQREVQQQQQQQQQQQLQLQLQQQQRVVPSENETYDHVAHFLGRSSQVTLSKSSILQCNSTIPNFQFSQFSNLQFLNSPIPQFSNFQFPMHIGLPSPDSPQDQQEEHTFSYDHGEDSFDEDRNEPDSNRSSAYDQNHDTPTLPIQNSSQTRK